MSAIGPTLPTLAVQQDGSYLGCTGNRLTYGPARRRIGSDNVPSRILSSPACGGSPGQAISFLSPARARLLEKNLGDAVGPELGIEHGAFLVP